MSNSQLRISNVYSAQLSGSLVSQSIHLQTVNLQDMFQNIVKHHRAHLREYWYMNLLESGTILLHVISTGNEVAFQSLCLTLRKQNTLMAQLWLEQNVLSMQNQCRLQQIEVMHAVSNMDIGYTHRIQQTLYIPLVSLRMASHNFSAIVALNV